MQRCSLRRPNVKTTTQTILEQGTDTVLLLLSAHTQISHANSLHSVNTTTKLAQYNSINSIHEYNSSSWKPGQEIHTISVAGQQMTLT